MGVGTRHDWFFHQGDAWGIATVERVTVGDNGATLGIGVDVTIRNLEAIYNLAKVDVGDTSCAILAKGNDVICRKLALKEFCNKAPGYLIWIRGKDRGLCK